MLRLSSKNSPLGSFMNPCRGVKCTSGRSPAACTTATKAENARENFIAMLSVLAGSLHELIYPTMRHFSCANTTSLVVEAVPSAYFRSPNQCPSTKAHCINSPAFLQSAAVLYQILSLPRSLQLFHNAPGAAISGVSPVCSCLYVMFVSLSIAVHDAIAGHIRSK